jgi:hypothetical protein
MITYYELGPDKKLNEIVMAGSHDAGVTLGKSNTQTQDLDIHEQAVAGVRLFDLRVTGAVVKKGAASDVLDLKAYHGVGSTSKKSGVDLRSGQATDIKVKNLSGGAYGMSLSKMLNDAAKFVTANATEFLILKFDKCDNWMGIAAACVDLLGGTIYRLGGNLNNKTLRDLQGKVIVLFSAKGQQAVHHMYGVPQGILAFKNIYEGGSYDENFHGLQYFGKGGTSIWNPFNKVNQNIKKQTKLMEKGGDGNPNVMGMMYWTTTGVTESIRDRNTGMWAAPNVKTLKDMWDGGLKSSIDSRMNKFSKIDGFNNAIALKAFMPNVIMIDFADETKVKHIFELNTTPVTFVVGAMKNFHLLSGPTHG